MLLLAFLFSFMCLSAPQSAEAAVAALTGNGWRTTAGTAISATAYFRGTTAVPGATNTYSIAAGANRLLVVALTVNTSAAQSALRPAVTYGGQALQIATSDQATSSRQHTWLFYLNDAGISAATSTNLSFTYTGNSGLTYTGTYANAAVFTGVDQTTPFLTPTTYNSGATANTTVGPLATSQVVATGNMAIEMVDILRTGSSTAATLTADTTPATWTLTANTTRTGTTPAAYAARMTIASITTAGTHDSTHTSSASVLDSVSAITLKAGGVTVANGSTVTAPSPGVYAGATNVVVDAFALGGSGTVTAITVTGNAGATSANVSAMRIYRKVGTNLTAYEASDVLIGSGVPNGTTPVSVTLSATETISATTNYIIVYDINPAAVANGTSITVSGAVTALTPTQVSLTDTGTAATILATTTLATGVEPAPARLWKSSAATNMDAFTLQHSGTSPTDDDTISNVTVTMTPQYISGGSGGTISKFKLIEIVSADGLTVYGSSNAATTGDTWNIPVTGLTATSTATTYYVRVTTADTITPSAADPSGTLLGYYTFGGTLTTLSHGRPNNKLVLADSASQTLVIDVEKPIGPTTATASTGTNGGEIDLVWDAGSDANGGSLDATTPYIVVRSAPDGTQPSPGCVDGTPVTLSPVNQSSRSVTDTGLVDTTPTRYYYRVCSKDAQGNISDGAASYANAKVTNICWNPPTISLTAEDGLSTTQLIKSANSAPFKLQVANNDIGTCADVNFTATLVNEVNSAHFDKNLAGAPFPATITLGTGGAGASTGKTLNLYVTGRPEANQLEQYTFAVQISSPGNSHGAPLTTQQVTGLLNDMPPIVHNSNNMAKYQYGNWGQTYTCATCHSNSTTNIKGIYQVISTPIGRRNVVFTKTSSVDTDSNGVFSTDQRAVKNVSNNVCSVCHHKTRQHQYSANKPFGGPNSDETYVNDHHNSRDCVRCHTHNTAFRSIYGLCGDCHGFKGTGYSPVSKGTMVKDLTNALGPNPPNYGAHARHNTAKITCAACHSNTNHGLDTTAWQGDNKLEMGFSINKDSFPGFNPNASVTGGTFYGTNNLNQPFVWSAGPGTTITPIGDYNNSCNTYCHGAWTGNSGNNTTPIWVGSGQVACGGCHNATGAVPPTTGSHAKHAANSGAGLGISCDKCHATYANYTGSAHINGKVEWNLGAYAGATYKGAASGNTGALAPTASVNYGTCTNLYCHSNVQGPTGTGSPTTYATPTWGGSAPCGSCHVYPNTTGSHANHENAEVAFDCHNCHDNGGTTSPLNHANGTINFQFVGLAQNTVYSRGNNVTPGTAYGNCSNSDCHGRFTRQWGTPSSGLTLCEKCHGSANSPNGFYNTQGPTGTLSVYSTGVGVHDIHIQNPNSPRKSTFARFTSYAAAFKCNQCHNVPTGPFTAGHIDTALPAEVPFSHASSIAHKGDAFGYYSTPTYSYATQACSNVYCHGAGMNSNRGTGKYVGTTPPVRTNPKWNVPYLTGDGNTDCTKCHALPPAAPDASYTHYGKTLNTCVSCHQHLTNDAHGFKNKALHVNGKVDGGCTGCHGNPPINNIVGDADGLAIPAQNALAGGAGAHSIHVNLPAIGNNCNTCHNSSDPAMPSNNLEIGFNMFNGVATTGTFTGYTNSVNGPKWKASSTGTTIVKSNVQAAVCSNLYCHGGGTTGISAIGGGTNTTPNWEATVACGDCHGVSNTNATVPQGGSHLKHASADNGGRGLTCDTCHGPVMDNGTHVNGQVTWHLDHTNPLVGDGATYNNLSSGALAGPAPRLNGSDYRTCNTFYCHSNVQGTTGTGTPTAYGSPRWGTDNATLTCASCHKNMATDGTATGSHVKHANTTTGMGVACGYCHQDAGSGTVLHADGAVYVNFTSYIGGSYSVGTPLNTGMNKTSGSAAYGTCSATFCHGTNASPAWGSPGPLACNTCHGAKVDSPNWSGRHNTHYNYSTAPTTYTQIVTDLSTTNKYRFNCAHCHDDNVAKHSLKPQSANSAARVFFGISSATPAASSKRGTYSYGATANSKTDNGFKYTAGSCNTSYCHSNGAGGAPKVTFLNWTTRPTAGSNCAFCHDTKSTSATASTLSGKHDKHMNPTNNAMIGTGNGFNCVDCHARTITNSNNIVVANKAKHVNALLDYSGAKANKNYNSTTKQCSNVYCHSNGNPNALVFVSMTGSKVWNGSGTITTCNKCHGRGNSLGYPDYANGGANTATSNLHPGHLSGMTDTLACSDCHRKTSDTLVANKFRPYSTTHLSGGTNVNFNTAKAYIGTKATVATAGFQVTCSQIVCHGQGTPVWGTSTTANQCQKCHGDRSTAFGTFSSPQVAPGYNGTGTDTSMVNAAPTSPRVGAHQRHLVSNAITTPVKCGECHVSVTNIRAGNHWNYSTATLTFNGRATAQSHVPSISGRTNGAIQCNNTFCHSGKYNSGSTIAPFWNMTGLVKETANRVDQACNKCHAMPPAAVGSHSGYTLNASDTMATVAATCGGCHNNLNPAATNVGNVFLDKSKHINGTIEGGNCLGCHATANGNRYGILGQFTSNKFQSHHVQGRTITAADCYQCHMEAADTNGTPDSNYHVGTVGSGAAVNLVVWVNGARSTTYISYTANGSRSSIAKLNDHCLGCHNTATTVKPFNTYSTHRYSPEARLATPKAKTSVQSRYSSTRTVQWSYYSYSSATGGVSRFGTNQKFRVTKALSAHGNAVNNQMQTWSDVANGAGDDGNGADYTNNKSTRRNVFCADCHNSHGSDATGITSSYSSATGRYKGGLLKSTKAGWGGYTVDYKPTSRTINYRNYSSTTASTSALFNAGAAICNDCHNNDTRKVNINKPWSITGTYSSTKAIVGYWSTPYFDNYTVNSVKRTAYKAGGAVGSIKDLRKPMGGHFGSSVNGVQAGHAGEINGLCTPCHDPHGVSNALGADRDHGVPLLKGTWITSPYREDKADKIVKRGGGSNYTGMNNMGAVPGYHIDQNTFIPTAAALIKSGGAATATAKSNLRSQRFRAFNTLSSALTLHTETTPSAFAGICLECHTQQALTGSATNTTSAPWMSKERVHQSVAGWASTNGTNTANKVHAYTCSKCHAPHVSRLPRLLVTNCLDARHSGQFATGSTNQISTATATTNTFGNINQSIASSARGGGRFPGGGSRYSGTPGSAQNSGGWWFQTNGAAGTVQPVGTTSTTAYGSNCHNATNAGGATWNPATQIWNKKSRW